MVFVLFLTLHAALCAGAPLPFGHSLRPHFFYPANVTQLNHGAYGGTTREIVSAQYSAVAEMESDLDNFMNGASGFRACILSARTRLAAMINADVEDVVLVDNASEGINAVLRNFEPPLTADEWILDLSTAYGPFAAFYEWLGVRQGVQTLTVPIVFPVTGADSFLTPVRAALDNSTQLNIRVAVISLISAYPAVTLPVAELVALLHARGIPVVIDAAHAIGNIAIDIAALGDPEYLMSAWLQFSMFSFPARASVSPTFAPASPTLQPTCTNFTLLPRARLCSTCGATGSCRTCPRQPWSTRLRRRTSPTGSFGRARATAPLTAPSKPRPHFARRWAAKPPCRRTTPRWLSLPSGIWNRRGACRRWRPTP
jgi:hypothetical protein